MGGRVRLVGPGWGGEAPGADIGATNAAGYLHQLLAGEVADRCLCVCVQYLCVFFIYFFTGSMLAGRSDDLAT